VKAVIVQPDGAAEVRELEEDLRFFQQTVGGYLEAVYGAHNEAGEPQVIILLNEDGKNLELPVNHKATALWWAIDAQAAAMRDRICGAVIVVGGPDGEGNMRDVPDDVAHILTI
jgi:hypothetical protein